MCPNFGVHAKALLELFNIKAVISGMLNPIFKGFNLPRKFDIATTDTISLSLKVSSASGKNDFGIAST